MFKKYLSTCALVVLCIHTVLAQVKFVKDKGNTTINVFIGSKLFTSFIYPDTLAKPVLYPIYTANGTMVTRGYPNNPKPGEPTDHPHHLGLWLNFENVNGLDFWNNSFAIPEEKKPHYGSIETNRTVTTKGGDKGVLVYHANWVNHEKEVLLEETTQYEFSASGSQRIIDRITVLKADTEVTFTDANDKHDKNYWKHHHHHHKHHKHHYKNHLSY